MLISGCNSIAISVALLFLLGYFIVGWPAPDFSPVVLLRHAKIHKQETTKHRQDHFPMKDDRETANQFTR